MNASTGQWIARQAAAAYIQFLEPEVLLKHVQLDFHLLTLVPLHAALGGE